MLPVLLNPASPPLRGPCHTSWPQTSQPPLPPPRQHVPPQILGREVTEMQGRGGGECGECRGWMDGRRDIWSGLSSGRGCLLAPPPQLCHLAACWHRDHFHICRVKPAQDLHTASRRLRGHLASPLPEDGPWKLLRGKWAPLGPPFHTQGPQEAGESSEQTLSGSDHQGWDQDGAAARAWVRASWGQPVDRKSVV